MWVPLNLPSSKKPCCWLPNPTAGRGGCKQGSSCAPQSGEMVVGGARRAQGRRSAKAAAQGSGVSLLGLAPGT